VIYQNSGSSGFTNGLIGFMLGRSMSHNDRPYSPTNSGGAYPSSSVNSGAGSPVGNIDQPAESTGTSALRIFLWLTILGVIGGGIWYFVRRPKSPSTVKRNYSL
jgi:hypothetical protein